MKGIIAESETKVHVEIFPQTYQSQEKYDNLLHEIAVEYNLPKLEVKLQRSRDHYGEDGKKKIIISFLKNQ